MIGRTEKLILEALEEPLTIEEITKKIGVHRITASKYLAVLDARGLVKYRFICKAKLFSRIKTYKMALETDRRNLNRRTAVRQSSLRQASSKHTKD